MQAALVDVRRRTTDLDVPPVRRHRTHGFGESQCCWRLECGEDAWEPLVEGLVKQPVGFVDDLCESMA